MIEFRGPQLKDILRWSNVSAWLSLLPAIVFFSFSAGYILFAFLFSEWMISIGAGTMWLTLLLIPVPGVIQVLVLVRVFAVDLEPTRTILLGGIMVPGILLDVNFLAYASFVGDLFSKH